MATFLKELPVKLTESEQNQRSRVATQKIAELRTWQNDVRDVQRKALTKEDKDRQDVIAGLSDAANTGYEPRQVECYEEPDYSSGICRIVRSDTGTVCDTRMLTESEMAEAQTSILDRIEKATRVAGDAATRTKAPTDDTGGDDGELPPH